MLLMMSTHYQHHFPLTVVLPHLTYHEPLTPVVKVLGVGLQAFYEVTLYP